MYPAIKSILSSRSNVTWGFHSWETLHTNMQGPHSLPARLEALESSFAGSEPLGAQTVSSALQVAAVCCSVLQRVAVCCSVLQCVAVSHGLMLLGVQ